VRDRSLARLKLARRGSETTCEILPPIAAGGFYCPVQFQPIPFFRSLAHPRMLDWAFRGGQGEVEREKATATAPGTAKAGPPPKEPAKARTDRDCANGTQFNDAASG
jgi:hypothetical protein